jgi:hypothetical protein
MPEAPRTLTQLRGNNGRYDSVRRPAHTTSRTWPWLEAKSGVVSDTTLEGYANSLDKHVLPSLGAYYYDAIGPMEV